MTADLDRSVAGIGDFERDGCSVLVQDDLAGCRKNFTGYHVSPRSELLHAGETDAPGNVTPKELIATLGLPNCVVNGNELGAIGEGHFDLHFTDHFGDAFHDLIACENLTAFRHELGDGFAVACSLHYEVCYDRDAFGIIELDASCQTPPGNQRHERDHKLVSFTRREVHELFSVLGGLSTTTSSAHGKGLVPALG